MKIADFQADFPGRLVPTTFVERLRDRRERTTAGEAFVPSDLPPPLDRTATIGRLFDVLDRAKTNLLRLEAHVDKLPDPSILLAAIQRREAQSSSQIENTFASLKEIAVAEIGGTDRSEPNEVHRNRLAIQCGISSELPISTRLVCEMHRLLIVEPRHRPGQLRDKQVCIGDEQLGFAQARFVPPPPSDVEVCMHQWERFCNPGAIGVPERTRWPELIELGMNHYQFEAIHPFSDGNGRLGRAIVSVAPIKSGLLKHPVCNLSEWVHQHRREYYDHLLRVSSHGEWEPWLRFFLTALAEQADLDLHRAARIVSLFHTYRDLLTRKRKSVLLLHLLDQLFRAPAITIPIAAKHLDVSYTAAQRHIEFLLTEKILEQVGSAPYGKIYVAMDIVRAIQGHDDD